MSSQVTLYLGIGSNIGDRVDNILSACERLRKTEALYNIRLSSIYETKPWGVSDQPSFLNCVARASSTLEPETVLEVIQQIESEAGRDKRNEIRWGPRVIDVDILLYGDEIISTERLSVPHPRMTERKFVLVPLLELDPLCKNPRNGIGYFEYLKKLGPQGIYYFSLKQYSVE